MSSSHYSGAWCGALKDDFFYTSPPQSPSCKRFKFFDASEEEEPTGGSVKNIKLEYVELQEERSSFNKKFKVHDKEYLFKFKKTNDLSKEQKLKKDILRIVLSAFLHTFGITELKKLLFSSFI